MRINSRDLFKRLGGKNAEAQSSHSGIIFSGDPTVVSSVRKNLINSLALLTISRVARKNLVQSVNYLFSQKNRKLKNSKFIV